MNYKEIVVQMDSFYKLNLSIIYDEFRASVHKDPWTKGILAIANWQNLPKPIAK